MDCLSAGARHEVGYVCSMEDDIRNVRDAKCPRSASRSLQPMGVIDQ